MRRQGSGRVGRGVNQTAHVPHLWNFDVVATAFEELIFRNGPDAKLKLAQIRLYRNIHSLNIPLHTSLIN